jgi:hypothetical protein
MTTPVTKRYPGLRELCPNCHILRTFVFKTGPGLCSYECEECGADWREPRRRGRLSKSQQEADPCS